MSTRHVETIYDPRFGITDSHWQDFCWVASQFGWIILVRAGKQAAIPWIKANFPAKPLAFKSKVDAHVGLLFARTESERENVFAHGHYVLASSALQVDKGPPSSPVKRIYIAEDGRSPAVTPRSKVQFNSVEHPWAQEDLIVDSDTLRPFTSDYDLGAVIDPARKQWGLTYMWVPLLGHIDGLSSRTNSFTDRVVDILNQRFQRGHSTILPRIVHGAEAQFSGGPAHGGGETILIFDPDQSVSYFECGSIQDAAAEMRQILRQATGTAERETEGEVIPLARHPRYTWHSS